MTLRAQVDQLMAEIRRVAGKVDGLTGPNVVNQRESLSFTRRSAARRPIPSQPLPFLFRFESEATETGMYGTYQASQTTALVRLDGSESPGFIANRIVDPAGGSSGTTLDVTSDYFRIPGNAGGVETAIAINLAENGQETFGWSSGGVNVSAMFIGKPIGRNPTDTTSYYELFGTPGIGTRVGRPRQVFAFHVRFAECA